MLGIYSCISEIFFDFFYIPQEERPNSANVTVLGLYFKFFHFLEISSFSTISVCARFNLGKALIENKLR